MMETILWTNPLVQEKFTLFSSYSCIIIRRDVQIKKIIMYYGRSQRALHDSIQNFVKLFFGMNIQG